MEKLQKRYEAWLSDYHNGELLFFIGFIIYLGRNTWATTTFPLPGFISKLCLLLPLLIIGIKIFFFDSYHARPLLILGLLLIGSFVIYYRSTYLNVLFWVILVGGSKNIPFKKILKVYLLIAGSIIFLAFCSSLLGVIENYQYVTRFRGIRNSFGITYTTDFAAHIFFLILTLYYLLGEKLKFYHYICTLIIAWLIYYFCNARLDSCSIVLIVIIFGLGNGIKHSRSLGKTCQNLWKQTWVTKGVYVMPFLASASLVTTILYRTGDGILAKLDGLLSSRLSLGNRGIKKYGYKLFGQPIEMVGSGGGTDTPDNYFFIDCSYLHIMLRYGVLFCIVVIIAYTIACYKNRNDLYFLYSITLLAINCSIAHHLLEFEYNPFALALLAVNIKNESSNNLISLKT